MTQHSSSVRDADVFKALREILSAYPGLPPVREMSRQAFDYRSSFALEQITVTFVDGGNYPVMFKDLGWDSLSEAGRVAKPKHLYDPLREIEVYSRVLERGPDGTPAYWGAVVDPPRERYWIFIAKAPGAELYQYGELEVWCHAARWLATFHHERALLVAAENKEVLPRLVRYDADYFRGWFDRGVKFVARNRGDAVAAQLASIRRCHDQAVEFLASLPTTFIHGEFYASNVLVNISKQPVRVCPVDWELAGIGPGVLDLAALVVGKWSDAQRVELIDAYRTGLPWDHPWSNGTATISRAVDFARLQLAIQWLGWSPDWTPPTSQAQDWLAEAIAMAKKLELAS
jgi:hypothetical protein